MKRAARSSSAAHRCDGTPAPLERVESALGKRLVACYDGVREHSPVPAVEAGRRLLEEVQANAVIAVGGGSAIVTARAALRLRRAPGTAAGTGAATPARQLGHDATGRPCANTGTP